jgi:hypothetical protein
LRRFFLVHRMRKLFTRPTIAPFLQSSHFHHDGKNGKLLLFFTIIKTAVTNPLFNRKVQ